MSAVLSIIEQLPHNAKVSVSLDSQSVIDHLRLILNNRNRFDKYLLTYPNYHLWAQLSSLLHDKNIVLDLIKIKAHSDNEFNNRADELAKRGALSTTDPLEQDIYSILIRLFGIVLYQLTWTLDILLKVSNMHDYIKISFL